MNVQFGGWSSYCLFEFQLDFLHFFVAFIGDQEVVQLDKCFLKSFLVILAFVFFIGHKIYGHVFFAEHRHLFSAVPIENSKEGIAVSHVEIVDVRVFI